MMADENNNQDAPVVDTPVTEPSVAAETQSQDSGDAVAPQREARGGRGGGGGGGRGGRDY